MITHSFDKNIYKVIYSGIVNFEEIINFLHEFSHIENLPKKLSLLYDLRDADLKVAPNELKKMSQVAEESTKKYTSVKTAFLVDDPKITAYSTLFSNQSVEKKTERKTFSTMEAALKWLNPSE
ncbi:MAG: hypothetical protein GQ564_09570 [Bacteroidales bacterium]|nr:hypothetical protein [Bacteroidales bacterium]